MKKTKQVIKSCVIGASILFTVFSAQASKIDIENGGGRIFGDFQPGSAGDVFSINAGSFGVTTPLSFQSGVFGNPGISGDQLVNPIDDEQLIGSDVNVVIVQNRDNDDLDGEFPSNWNASWNARTALAVIADNTSGDRAGFFMYWNEGLGVNRLFATDNLNDATSSLTLLFTDQSATLTGVPGEFDLNLSNGEPTRTDLFPEANANLAELALYTSGNFTFSDQVSSVSAPAGMSIVLAGMGFLGVIRRRMYK